ncbi:MAG: hypothetical protein ACE5EQ_05360 [Phycisphaerae bacterium]
MVRRLGNLLRCALPLTAVVSLLCGPSPSAAFSAYSQRLVEKQVAEHAAEAAGNRYTPPPSGAKPEQKSEESVSSFVPPTAAKPVETDKTVGPVGLFERYGPPTARHEIGLKRSLRRNEPHRRLHHPCYRATAPPCQSTTSPD